MNILKNTQICKILHEIYLRKNCLKFKSIWASYILSDEPTDGQMQKQNKTKTPKKPTKVGLDPLPPVGHTETENKKDINNKPKGHYTGYSHRQTSQ